MITRRLESLLGEPICTKCVIPQLGPWSTPSLRQADSRSADSDEFTPGQNDHYEQSVCAFQNVSSCIVLCTPFQKVEVAPPEARQLVQGADTMLGHGSVERRCTAQNTGMHDNFPRQTASISEWKRKQPEVLCIEQLIGSLLQRRQSDTM